MDYCTNCDTEATKVVEHANGSRTLLCSTCATSYEWGQDAGEMVCVEDLDSLDLGV